MYILIRKAKKEDFKALQELNLEIERVECNFDSNLVSETYLTADGIKILKEDLKNKNFIF